MDEFFRQERFRSFRAALVTLPLAAAPLIWSAAGLAGLLVAASVVMMGLRMINAAAARPAGAPAAPPADVAALPEPPDDQAAERAVSRAD